MDVLFWEHFPPQKGTMPYQTIQHFIRDFGPDAWDTLLECAQRREKHHVIAAMIRESKRTGEKLSRRRVSQIIAKCIQYEAKPNEISQFYLDNILPGEEAVRKYAEEKINELKQQARKAHRELLRHIPGGRPGFKSASKG